MLPREYLAHDAVGLAGLVRRREVSAEELLDCALRRAEALDPQLNAIVQPMHALARERAKGSLSGPLAGVPFLVKDLLQEYAGVPSSDGSRAYKRRAAPAGEHAEITRRWLSAGLVVFGRTNTPEFGAKGITEPLAWGPTRNPWSLAHSPGGSSGGSAAAVAAGIVPAAGANDGGGSIRIPASYTGLFGLKPGRGRTPSGPRRTELMHGAAVNHVLSRSVRDSALLLDVTHGPERGSWFKIAAPERPYLEQVARDPAPLRIGFSVRSPLDAPVDREAVCAVERAAQLLSSLGHHVEAAEPRIDGGRLGNDFLQMWFVQMALRMQDAQVEAGGRGDEFELDTHAMAALGRSLSADVYARSYEHCNDYLAALASFHERYDLYMTPTTAGPAPRIGELATPSWAAALLRAGLALGVDRLLLRMSPVVETLVRDNLGRVPFTQLANLTGVPAMSVPLHRCESGLPLGVQFVAGHGGEGLLFSLAGQLERAEPWPTCAAAADGIASAAGLS